jgi:Family of unknown function (DUF6223)
MSLRALLALPDATHPAVAAAGYVLGTGRAVPTAAAVAGLVGAVLGGMVLARSRWFSARGKRTASGAAVLLGLAAAVVGGVHAANAAGGLGTGNGLAGAVLAVVLGAVGVVLGGLGLARSRAAAPR